MSSPHSSAHSSKHAGGRGGIVRRWSTKVKHRMLTKGGGSRGGGPAVGTQLGTTRHDLTCP
eukprot:752299-Hanusia_phi.AAC.1